MPTLEQLTTEITEGPFAVELSSAWSDVFPVEPEPQEGDFENPERYQAALARWNRVKDRAGQLKPDAALAIWSALTDQTRRTRTDPYVNRGVFLAGITSLAFGLVGKPADEVQKWQTILNLATGGDERIYLPNVHVQGLLDIAVSEGLLSEGAREGLRTGETAPCSRSDELGWDARAYTLVVEAKASVA